MYRTVLVLLMIMPGFVWGDPRPAALDAALSAATGQMEERIRQLDSELSRIEVSPVTRNIRIPMDTREFQVRLPDTISLGSRVRGWVDFVRNSGAQTTLPIWFEVRAFKRVPTAARDLKAHEVVGDDAVIIREINVAGVRLAEPLKDSSGPRRTRRFIVAGRPLYEGDVELLPPIMAQQTVAVRVVSGPVVIATTAVAEQEGHIGQVIRVRNQSSTEQYKVLVTGNQQVEASVQ
jgi:flagellar basal body P-ring formation protein FlgA